MKSKILFLTAVAFLSLVLATNAQKPFYPKPGSVDQIPFGKKSPPPFHAKDENVKKPYDKMKGLPYTFFDTVLKQFIINMPGRGIVQNPSARTYNSTSKALAVNSAKNSSAVFHLTRDINTTVTGSFPSNFPINAPPVFAILNNTSYFSADDGIHGRELWRSDGTPEGTFLVKDINPGEAGSNVSGIVAANGLLFFSAITPENGVEPWVSDGTESGTHLLTDINLGIDGSNPNQFVNINGSVFFITSLFNTNNQLWKTDGTQVGTILVKDISQAGIGYSIFELTAVKDMAYFIAYTYNSGFQLFKSDGTDAGTYVVKEIGFYNFDVNAPTQLTAYNNKLYFSGNDGTGRRLWTSDGTADGTTYAAGFTDVFMQPDFVKMDVNTPFPILNNVLYLSGFTPADGSGLYKYDASNSDGIVLVKDLTDLAPDINTDFVVPVDMIAVNDILYFKVISNTGDWHDELWSTKGETANTQPIKSFVPGEQTYFFYNANGTVYFVKYDTIYGNELWKSDGTDAGTLLVSDINPGSGASFPSDLTFCNGKLLFSATDNIHGNELWGSDGSGAGTSLVKAINPITTGGSDAGFQYKGLSAFGNGEVLFNAFTPALGAELYKSDGKPAATALLNDIWTGPDWSYPNAFLFKNNVSYFIDDDAISTTIYKTNGTSAGLQRIIPYINRDIYYVVNFNITDNGQVFYILGNRATGVYELWHSDGTDAGTYLLNANINYNDYVVTIGNTAYFAAGDVDHGYEIWKSNGTLAGTRLLKDIYTGPNGSYPYSLFAYKNHLYFGAGNGGLNNSLWKSDGTEKGTIKLKDITPAYFNENFVDPPVPVFCISDNILYFTATDFNTYGAELWKTDGTKAGTKMVKDINSGGGYSNPNNLTDVKGKLYFTADDGVHGSELWTSNGTARSTRLVKDIMPDFFSSNIYNFCSAGGKLYFLNNGALWSSDGSVDNTNEVIDEGLTGLFNISHLTGAGKKLFFGANSYKYGTELYEGNVNAASDAPAIATTEEKPVISGIQEKNETFDAILYPNPTQSITTLQIKGDAKDVVVAIIDITGRLIWKSNSGNSALINLPTEKLTPGVYLVTIKNSTGSKIIKLVKK
ncbi:MAG: ELWxxDGT repeat protein [Ginsengibacter sp.]